jgi:uncharacterized protein (DUF1501 family)
MSGQPARLNPSDPEYPAMGSIFKRVRPAAPHGLPNYVAINPYVLHGAGYLGRQFEAFNVHLDPNSESFYVPNLTVPSTAAAHLDDRRRLLASFDQVRRDIDASGTMRAMDSYNQEAVRVLTSDATRLAFDIHRGDPRERDRYGRNQFGQGLFLARRLIEAGVGFVHVEAMNMGATLYNWDDHSVNSNIFEQMRLRLPAFDRGIAALIEDIHERGLDRDVLVVVTGEFGRTGRIETGMPGRPGRDHNPGAMSILVSGGGLRMGQVVGSTDSRGDAASTRHLHPTDLLATMYHFLGIDQHREFRDLTGRPHAILPRGTPIEELVG